MPLCRAVCLVIWWMSCRIAEADLKQQTHFIFLYCNLLTGTKSNQENFETRLDTLLSKEEGRFFFLSPDAASLLLGTL